MKAILLSRTGDPSVLDYVEVPTPRPKPGEVLVKADTIGVSRPELLVRRGVYPWMPPLPAIPGIEMAGTVAELGEGAARFKLGQKVYVTARELPVRAGCYAEYIAVPERALYSLPPNTDLEAAACLSNYQVAWHLLHTATRGAPGKSVLVNSASGGLGSAAVQLARLAGMTAIALVGSAAKARALTAFGADHVIVQGEDVAARVKEITAKMTEGHVSGVDLILDAVGGRDFAKFLPMLGPFGLAVSYGKLVGKIEGNVIDALDSGPAYLNSTAVRIFTMHTLDDKPHLRAQSMNDLIGKLGSGQIRPLIHARLPLRDARRAHEMIEAREVIGKILLKP
jgi:NADPH2:quinone reductase